MIANSTKRALSCRDSNGGFWPFAAGQKLNFVNVRVAAIDPKRTVAPHQTRRLETTHCGHAFRIEIVDL
jgi:hypothetical protein